MWELMFYWIAHKTWRYKFTLREEFNPIPYYRYPIAQQVLLHLDTRKFTTSKQQAGYIQDNISIEISLHHFTHVFNRLRPTWDCVFNKMAENYVTHTLFQTKRGVWDCKDREWTGKIIKKPRAGLGFSGV